MTLAASFDTAAAQPSSRSTMMGVAVGVDAMCAGLESV